MQSVSIGEAGRRSGVKVPTIRYYANCVEKLRLISVRCADSFSWGVGDSADDGRTAGDAGGAVLRLQP